MATLRQQGKVAVTEEQVGSSEGSRRKTVRRGNTISTARRRNSIAFGNTIANRSWRPIYFTLDNHPNTGLDGEAMKQ